MFDIIFFLNREILKNEASFHDGPGVSTPIRFLQGVLGAFPQNCEKRLLASSCFSVSPSVILSVCLFAWHNSAPVDGF